MTSGEIALLVARQHERQAELHGVLGALRDAPHPWLATQLHEHVQALRTEIGRSARELDLLLAACDAAQLQEIAAPVA